MWWFGWWLWPLETGKSDWVSLDPTILSVWLISTIYNILSLFLTFTIHPWFQFEKLGWGVAGLNTGTYFSILSIIVGNYKHNKNSMTVRPYLLLQSTFFVSTFCINFLFNLDWDYKSMLTIWPQTKFPKTTDSSCLSSCQISSLFQAQLSLSLRGGLQLDQSVQYSVAAGLWCVSVRVETEREVQLHWVQCPICQGYKHQTVILNQLLWDLINSY